MGGRTVLNRPRTDLEVLTSLLFDQDPSFVSGTASPQYIVKRDPRGYAALATAAGSAVPSPLRRRGRRAAVGGPPHRAIRDEHGRDAAYAVLRRRRTGWSVAGRDPARTRHRRTARLRLRRHESNLRVEGRGAPPGRRLRQVARGLERRRQPRDADESAGGRLCARGSARTRCDADVRNEDADVQRIPGRPVADG